MKLKKKSKNLLHFKRWKYKQLEYSGELPHIRETLMATRGK